MATKEDILEQVVEEYLIHKGYFVQHNLKFKPSAVHPEFNSQKDSNHSDIDVLGYHPRLSGTEKVLAVNCKSWQSGFNPVSRIEKFEKGKTANGREAWKGFRELLSPKWSEAFSNCIYEVTGETVFTHVTAVTYLKGNSRDWEDYPTFSENLNGNPVMLLTFENMIREIDNNLTTTLAATEVGRLLQLFKASKYLSRR